jgi:cell volume regulation protein A
MAVIGALVGLAATLSRVVGGKGIPVMLLFLLVGMLAGSEGIGGIAFENYAATFQLGTVALVFILFDGGLNTSLRVVRAAFWPSATLATVGVALTAAGVALAGRALGLGWLEAALLGAVISSTDAAAVFSVLRGSGVKLQQRVAATLEVESGLNDPMAVMLTIGFTEALLAGERVSATLVLEIALQLVLGGVLGVVVGRLGRWGLRRPLFTGGLYPVLTLSVACLAFGLTTLLGGSGFLAVYVAGLVLGNGRLPYRTGIVRAHDFLAWFSQVVMFLVFGLLAFPSRLLDAFVPGLVVAVVLALVARPLAAILCLTPFGFRANEIAYVGWVGLRGAVPIVLAIVPMMAGIDGAQVIFDIVFFVVVVSALLQGGSVPWATRKLGLETSGPPPPPASVEIASVSSMNEEILTFHVDLDSPVRGRTFSELAFPEGASAVLVARGQQLVAPRGNTKIEEGDFVSVFCRPEDRRTVESMFLSKQRAT